MTKKSFRSDNQNHPREVTDGEAHRSPEGFVDQWCEIFQRGQPLPDLRAYVAARADLPAVKLLELILIDQKFQWNDAPGPRVEEYLEYYPSIGADSEHVLDLVYGEIRARRKLGFPCKVEQYSSRFPDLTDRLVMQLELVHWLDDGALEKKEDDAPAPSGEKSFGQYDLIEPIHRSAMSIVFRARHRALNRTVALKMMPPEMQASSDDLRRFKNEMLAVAQLDHRNILPILEVGECDGSLYYTSRYAELGTLADNLARFQRQPKTAATFIRDVSLALHHAHQRGVLHRDLKPSNVLLDENHQPLVADFGLARLYHQTSDLTQSGDLLGTPVWLAPEQADRKPNPATIACDVYGIGALLYYLLTGLPPFGGDSLMDTLTQVRDRDPIRPRKIDPQVDGDLEMICLKAMDKNPARRYPTAAALASDLDSFLTGGAISARPLPWWEQQRRWVVRNPLTATTTGLFLLGGLIWTVTAFHYASRERALNARLDSLVENVERSNAEAEQFQAEALEIRDQADDLREEQRRILYAAHLRQAGIAQQLGDVRQVFDSLSRELPRPGQVDLRGIEWHWLWDRNQAESKTARHFVDPMIARFSNDGRWLAVAERGGPVTVLDTRETKSSRNLTLGKIENIAFSPSSKFLVTSGHDPVIQVWNVEEASIQAKVELPHEAHWFAEFIDDSKLLVTDKMDQLFLVDWKTPGSFTPVASDIADLSAVATCSTRRLIAGVGSSGIRIWDADSLNQRWLIEIENALESNSSSEVQFSPTGDRIAFVDGQGQVLVYDLSESELPQLIFARSVLDEVLDICFFPSGDQLAVGTITGGIHVWPITQNKSEPTLSKSGVLQWQGHQGRTTSITVSQSGLEIVSVGTDNQLHFWSLDSPPKIEFLETSPIPNGGDAGLAIGKSNGTLAAGSEHGIQIWDLKLKRLLETIDVDGGHRNQVCVSPSGNHVAAINLETGKLELWKRLADKAEWSLAQPGCEPMAFSPNGKSLIVVDRAHDQVLVLDATTGRRLNDLPAVGCMSAAFSPDGLQLAITIDDVIQIWNSQTWSLNKELRGHRDAATTVTYSPDGQWIASAGKDRSIRIWNAASGHEQQRLLGHLDDVRHVAFSPDGRSLASSSIDGTIKIWHVATGEFLTELWNNQKNPACSLEFVPAGNQLVARLTQGQILLFNFF